jgi:neurofibromin 1
VVTDSRFVFQPIVKLSKTKGKVDVVIKVGSQFIQVTTTKKQEIVPGLRLNATVPGLRLNATVNDIFRLTDVAEANTSIHTDDDSAFGIRTENGKVALYFTSPRKQDILQAIRAAKAKQGKDAKPLKPIERLVRPEDVPGTLLNISLINMASYDQSLRLASYNLLCSLCRAFHFTLEKQFVNAKGTSDA